MKYQLIGLFATAFFLLTAFIPRKIVYVPNQVVTLNVQDNLFVVGEQREGAKKAGFYSFYTINGIPIQSGILQGLGDTSISLICAKEMGWGMAIGGTFLSGNNRQKGIYVATKWGNPGKELDKSVIKVYLPEIESVLAIGESRGMPVLLGKQGGNLLLMTPKAGQKKREFDDLLVLPNWSSISVAKWLNEEVFVVAGKNQDGGLRVAKFNAKGEIEADVNPKIDCQGKIKITQQNTKTGYHYVIPALENEREPVCKPSEDAILEIKDLALGFDNSLVLAGNYQSDESTESDAWFARLSVSLDTVLYEIRPEGKFSRGRNGYDSLSAIDTDPNNGDWLLTGITYSNRFGQRSPDIQVWRVATSAVTPGKYVYKIPDQQKPQDDKGIVSTETLDYTGEEGKYIILSNTLLMFYPTSEEIGVTQWPLNLGNTSVPKANVKGESHPDLNFKDIFFDDTDTNTNSILEEDESAFISVLVTRSNLNNYKEIKFTLAAESDKGSIICGTQSCTLKEGKKSDRFRIPVKAGKVKDGEVFFTIKCNGKEIEAKPLSVTTQGKAQKTIKPELGKVQSKNTDNKVSIELEVKVYERGSHKMALKLKNSNLATPKQKTRESSQVIDKDFGILHFAFEFPRSSEYFNEGDNSVDFEVISPSGDTSLFPRVVKVSIKKPHLFGYFFGVPDTQSNSKDTLKYTAKDAEDFANACKKMDSRLYSGIDVHVYNNRQLTTRESIADTFETIRQQHENNSENDVILIFFSAHAIEKFKRLHIKTSDKEIDFQALCTILKDIKNKKIYVFLDVCHAGIAEAKGNGSEPLIDSLNKYSEGLFLFTSTGDSPAYECPDSPYKNGAYIAALLEGIKGSADGFKGGLKDGLITIQELDDYLRSKVNDITKEYCKRVQSPGYKCAFGESDRCPDIPIFSVIKP